jgi:cytochrome c oxidase subunit 2
MVDLPLFPPQASTIAGEIDFFYFVLIGLSALFATPVAILLVYFAVRYRRGITVNRVWPSIDHYKIELTWSVIPFLLAMGVFTWGVTLYFRIYTPPRNTLDISIVGRQWMWKAQHPNGRREINQLHVPVNRPVKLTMISQDVIHSFYIPAFRVKQDVLPGRYTVMWFEATRPGEYHLFCTEYCGTDHSGMIGSVIVLEEAQYQSWLSGNISGEPLAVTGERLFQQLGCATCHRAENEGRGPSLVGLFGQPVQLANEQTVTVDEAYIRESILQPNAKTVAGYEQVIMPTFEGQISEEGILQITAYLKSLETDQNSSSEE